MSRDEVVFAGLCASFGALVVCHAWLVLGLAGRRPRWRALVALVVVPLAPFWGRTERLHARAVAWVVLALTYGAMLWLATR